MQQHAAVMKLAGFFIHCLKTGLLLKLLRNNTKNSRSVLHTDTTMAISRYGSKERKITG
jgi:hypothetical protein